jgi:hypothetical protein
MNLYLPIFILRSIDRNNVVHEWSGSAMNGPVARLNKIFFSNRYRRGRNAKFGWLVENRTRYLMQHLLTFYAQHIPLFLSINLTWSIEGNLILHILIVSLCVLALVMWHSNLIFSGRIILPSVACLEQRDFRKSY